MNDRPKGKCPHGEFYLDEGCPQCIAEKQHRADLARRLSGNKPEIVKVQFLNEAGEPDGRPYSYFTAEALALGDVVQVPVSKGNNFPEEHFIKAAVVAVNVPEAEIVAFRDKVKTIPSGSKRPPTQAADFKPANPEFVTESPPAKMFADPPVSISGGIPEGMEVPEAETTISETAYTEADPDIPEQLPVPIFTIYREIGRLPNRELIQACQEANRLLEIAKTRIISNNDDLKPATDDLAVIANGKKIVLEIKAQVLAPWRAKVDTFNTAFNEILKPLEEADRITRGKVKEYREIELEKTALAEREAAAKGGEITVELGKEVPDRTRTEMATQGMRDNWKARVVDFAKLPDEYKLADMQTLNAKARTSKGKAVIPGVEFYNDRIVTVRNKN